MTECCEYHATGHADYHSETRQLAVAAQKRLAKRGEVGTVDVHLIARLHLGLLDDPHVACEHCGVLDYQTRGLQAALNWPSVPAERLRRDARGKIFSVAPETDYIRLCIPCHRRLDSWRNAYLGHSNVGTTDRYIQHLNPRAAIDAMLASQWGRGDGDG